VDEALRTLLEQGEISAGKLNGEAVQVLLEQDAMAPPVTQVAVVEVSLKSFDDLLGKGVMQ
jgi:hypothetical protein